MPPSGRDPPRSRRNSFAKAVYSPVLARRSNTVYRASEHCDTCKNTQPRTNACNVTKQPLNEKHKQAVKLQHHDLDKLLP